MKKQETVGFQLSAAVPLDRVGFILKAFFDNGCPPSSLDLKALIGTMPNGHGSRVHAIDAEPVPQIEPRKRIGRPPGTVGRMSILRTAILAFLHEHKKVSRQELHVHIMKDNPSHTHAQSIDTAVLDFVKKGILRRPEVGFLTMTEQGHKAFEGSQPAAPEPASSEPAPLDEPIGLKGNHAFAYSVLRAQPERSFTLADVQHAFTASGRNPNSAKDTLVKLTKRNFIHRSAPGKYTLLGA